MTSELRSQNITHYLVWYFKKPFWFVVIIIIYLLLLLLLLLFSENKCLQLHIHFIFVYLEKKVYDNIPVGKSWKMLVDLKISRKIAMSNKFFQSTFGDKITMKNM